MAYRQLSVPPHLYYSRKADGFCNHLDAGFVFKKPHVYGTYKGRRELLWISGCVLFAHALGMAFTGYLLLWDISARILPPRWERTPLAKFRWSAKLLAHVTRRN